MRQVKHNSIVAVSEYMCMCERDRAWVIRVGEAKPD